MLTLICKPQLPTPHKNTQRNAPPPPTPSPPEDMAARSPDDDQRGRISNSHSITNLPMPTSTSYGVTTFAHNLALQNRLQASKLQPGGELDPNLYTPTFLHDVLMLPGSLAALLDKGSSEDLISRLTPAILPGFNLGAGLKDHHGEVDDDKPVIQPSRDPEACVKGMLVLGQGKRQRDSIHAHYRPLCRRVKVEVLVDVLVSGHNEERRLERAKLRAHVWVMRDGEGEEGEVAG